jgi:pimeloyl-ACP methyl ester carboxylesterase
MAETSTPTPARRLWPLIRRIWAIAGTVAFVGLAGWSFLAFRATGIARQALIPDDQVQVTRAEGHWLFMPRAVTSQTAGLLFFPGGLVEAAAYAPLTRAAAEAGFPAILVQLPRRGAFGGADDPRVLARARTAIAGLRQVATWVVAGHSRGGVIASRFARDGGLSLSGLVLIGTSHPRDFSLANLTMPVVKILGTRDCVAEVEKSEANRHLLPPTTRWITIDGANHSQFGWYGFQPGDCWATIDRERQHATTLQAVLEVLSSLAR